MQRLHSEVWLHKRPSVVRDGDSARSVAGGGLLALAADRRSHVR